MVIMCEAVAGPLQPAAEAVTIEVPFQPALHVTNPVDALMVLPPAILAGSSEYVRPVELVALAV